MNEYFIKVYLGLGMHVTDYPIEMFKVIVLLECFDIFDYLW